MKRMASIRKFIDIGANLTDEMYQGVYHSSKKHEPDLDKVLERSWSIGMYKIIITGGSLIDSKKSIDMSQSDSRLFSTVGCHPTRCNEFVENPEKYLNDLRDLITSNRDKVVAIGECGLDYERLHFCEKIFNLTADDLVEILHRNRDEVVGGVVHSFDGPVDALEKILSLGLHIGINGCSLRTKENLEVVSKIPQNRLMIETDCPWCEIKPTHPGYAHVVTKYPSVKKEKYLIDSGNQIKGRNEPANIVQVLEILSAVRNENIDDLTEAIYNNTNKLFFNCN